MKIYFGMLVAGFFSLAAAGPVLADTPAGDGAQAEQAVAQARGFKPVGTYSFKFAMIPVYEAVLLAPGGKYDPKGAYALQLTYRINVNHTAIASRGVAEMKKQGHNMAERTAWKPLMLKMIPNMSSGETLTAIHLANGGMVMEKGLVASGGTVTGTASDAKLTQAFFDIWLGPNTTQPEQRSALLGP